MGTANTQVASDFGSFGQNNPGQEMVHGTRPGSNAPLALSEGKKGPKAQSMYTSSCESGAEVIQFFLKVCKLLPRHPPRVQR